MTSFFGELRRRNVVKVAVAYAIVGWLLIEVSSVLGPALNLPDWATSLVAFFLILGFPVAMLLTWAYELTPDGMERTKSVPLSESITKVTGRKLDFVIIGVLAIAVAFFAVDRFVLDTSGPFAGTDIDPASLDIELDEPPSIGVELAPAIAEDQPREVLPNSVAVLPFENVSPNSDDAYFATGIHEEILNQLAKLSALNVIARTSMRQYANTEKSIPEIARELNVETVMEGSVRYARGQVRITTQLNDGVTGAHIWSETYTRDFDDIFAIESDVAMNVANALEAEFSVTEQESIEKVPTDSPEAYALYLRAVAAGPEFSRIADLEQALVIDPSFALAYALNARLRSGLVTFGVDVDAAAEERLAIENAESALALDSSLGLAHIALADVHQTYWRWAEARKAFEIGYELSPSDAEVLAEYGRFKRNTGNYTEAIRVGVRAVELDPFNIQAIIQLAVTYRFARDNEAAAQLYRRQQTLFPLAANGYSSLGVVEATRGNYEEAVRNLRRAEELFGENITQVFRYAHLAQGYALAGEHQDAERVVSALTERAQETSIGEAVWALAYIALGDYDQALTRLRAAMAAPSSASYVTLLEIKANPWADPVLDEPRFRDVLSGLWPE